MKDQVKIIELELMTEKFDNWTVEFESTDNEYRLYSVKNVADSQFEFIALRLYNFEDDQDNGWNSTSIVDELFTGKGVFDGVRHLSLNPYINYPSFDNITKMLSIISVLEKEICTEM